ncbi:MAG: MqnA/MqnD/SBP family protein, partial [Thermodesulfobacteriota bacterium]|nr:MqnA/MqnD/SBP family protein [Thermodesulfobacteriota bacterium]
YDQVAGAVASGLADAGLLIHETALVPERHGLEVRLDLGRWWAGKTGGVPLPLGVIVASREFAPETSEQIGRTIRDSLAFARQNREAVWPLVRAHARELDDETLEKHIRAYVNDMSLDMGETGHEALSRLEEMLRKRAVSQ